MFLKYLFNLKEKKLQDHLQAKAYEFEKSVREGKYYLPAKVKPEEFSQSWANNWLVKKVSNNIIILRLGSLKNHILSVIGHLKLEKITTFMLVELMNNLTDRIIRKEIY